MNLAARASAVHRLLAIPSLLLRRNVRCHSMASPVDSGAPRPSTALWCKHRLQAARALYHPFVVSLAAGVLDIRSFQHYIAQDTFFLQAFSTAYQFVRDNVDDDKCKLTLSELLKGVEDELQLHSSYAQAWGVDLSTPIHPHDATANYTRFLLGTTDAKEIKKGETNSSDMLRAAAFTIGAMTPCMSLYAFLGQETRKHIGAELLDDPYHEWIETYSSELFQSSALKMEGLLDSLAACLGDNDMPKLEQLYSQAFELELEFFSGQPYCHCIYLPFIRRKINGSDANYLLMADFDMTCSVTDSCSVLADISIKSALEAGQESSQQPYHQSESERKRRWDVLQTSYQERYGSISAPPSGQENSGRHPDIDGLRSFLVPLSDFEVESNAEIIRQGVFEGLNVENVQRAGRDMALQEGCAEFLQNLSLLSNVTSHIISVCWSTSLLKGALSKEGLDSIEIHANELVPSISDSSVGINRSIETPFDKERVLKELRAAESYSGPVQSIYIGDSVTDILCLLEADLGIVVGSNQNLRKVANTFGVMMVPLYEGILKMAKKGSLQGGKKSALLYTVTDWHEIRAFLTG